MHQRTSSLIPLAKEDGDEFIQYLYRIALMHIEDKAREAAGKKRSEVERPVDPEIKDLATKLLKMRG